MKKEIWELCDIEGNGVGILHERGQRMPKGLYHPVVEIWSVLPDGRILLTQRHPNKHYPMLWECSGGSILSGESFETGAARELEEETGITVAPEELVYLGTVVDLGCVLKSYLVRLDYIPVLTLQESEVVGHKFVTPEELEAMKGDMTDWAREHYFAYKSEITKK